MFIDAVREVEIKQVGLLNSVLVNGKDVFSTESFTLATEVMESFLKHLDGNLEAIFTMKVVKRESD